MRSCTASTRRGRSPRAWPIVRSSTSRCRCAMPGTSSRTPRRGHARASSRSSSLGDGSTTSRASRSIGERSALPERAAPRRRHGLDHALAHRGPAARRRRLDRGRPGARGGRRDRPRRSPSAPTSDRASGSTRRARRSAARLEERPRRPRAGASRPADDPALLARTTEVPGFGWTRFEAAPLASPATADDGGPVTIGNGLVTVVVDAATGTFSVDGHAGFGRLVDDGDLGDSYNYQPSERRRPRRPADRGRRRGDRARARPRPRRRSSRPTSGPTTSTAPPSSASAPTGSR